MPMLYVYSRSSKSTSFRFRCWEVSPNVYKCYYAIETTFVSNGRTKSMFQEFEFTQSITYRTRIDENGQTIIVDGKPVIVCFSSVGIKVGLAMVVVDLKTGNVIESENCDIL